MILDLAIVAIVTYACGSWIHGASVAVLLLIWKGIPNSEGPPVLKLAMTTQWMQVAIGPFYTFLTGEVMAIEEIPAYGTTMVMGLGSVAALTIGLIIGLRAMQQRKAYPELTPEEMVSFSTLLVIYGVALALTGVLQELAGVFEPLRQAVVALSLGRLAVVSLVLRRLMRPTFRWDLVIALLTVEVALGFTGYFSGFKEPLLLATLALLEVFDRKRSDHVVAVGVLGVTLLFAAVMWIGVRAEYREDFADAGFAASRGARLTRMQALFTDWYAQAGSTARDSIFAFVDRTSAVYYPALAVNRVPSVLPHTDGSMLATTMLHIVTPRLLFPDKPPLISESELVRKYSGVWVAGDESDTSIAFGYAAEMYLDFGIPMMFLPILLYGAFMGGAYEWFLRTIAHRELAVSVTMALFWITLYLYEKAFAKLLGDSLTIMVYVGGLAYLVDRWLLIRAREVDEQEREYEAQEAQRSLVPAHPHRPDGGRKA